MIFPCAYEPFAALLGETSIQILNYFIIELFFNLLVRLNRFYYIMYIICFASVFFLIQEDFLCTFLKDLHSVLFGGDGKEHQCIYLQMC